MTVYLENLALFAPGLCGWSDASRAVLAGTRPYAPGALPPFAQSALPRNEARRAGFSVRLALQVAQEALFDTCVDGSELISVFACSGGDTEALDKILSALCTPGRPVSPNVFNNSVHNAAAGYWSIVSRNRAPSLSLSAFDASFSAGLLESCCHILTGARRVILVAYDVPPPPALLPFRPVDTVFASAFLFSAEPGVSSLYRLRIALAAKQTAQCLDDPELERLRATNPAARCLVLLRLLAQNRPGTVFLPYLEDTCLRVEAAPC